MTELTNISIQSFLAELNRKTLFSSSNALINFNLDFRQILIVNVKIASGDPHT
jgi:hypothetical protein